MRASIRRVGNSSGIILPKPVMTELGVKEGDDLSLTIEGDRIVLVALKAHPRQGWAEESKAIAAAGDDELVWPEFGNLDDDRLTW